MNRKNKLTTLTLNSQDDPLTQLISLCKQGNYKYTFCWDFFENGIMCECEVYYKIKTRHHTIARKTYFVKCGDIDENKRVDHVKKTLAALVLNEVGLWDVPEDENTDTQNKELGKLFQLGSKAIVTHLNSLLDTENKTGVNVSDSKELVKGVGDILNNITTDPCLPMDKFVGLLKTYSSLGDVNIRDRWADQE
jgi:hypothetical protein